MNLVKHVLSFVNQDSFMLLVFDFLFTPLSASCASDAIRFLYTKNGNLVEKTIFFQLYSTSITVVNINVIYKSKSGTNRLKEVL